MSPQEKAFDMILLFIDKKSGVRKEQAKRYALICVDQIIAANPHSNPFNTDVHSTMSYWLEVKQEIEKL